MDKDKSYDATRDPRTGRPILPFDAEKARQAASQQDGIALESTTVHHDNNAIEKDDGDSADPMGELDHPDDVVAEEDVDEPGDIENEDESYDDEGPESDEPDEVQAPEDGKGAVR